MKTKLCTGCNKQKPLDAYTKRSKSPDSLNYKCKECKKSLTGIYKKTLNGITTQVYSSQKMSSKRRKYPLPNYTKIELKEWISSQPNFEELYNNWVKSGYDKWLKPSCDRLDDYKSYTLDNLQLLTWRQNNIKAHNDKINGINNKSSKTTYQYTLSLDFVNVYYSVNEASRQTKINRGDIASCCRGGLKTAGGYIWKYKE